MSWPLVVRSTINWLNLSTLLGLVVAVAGRADIQRFEQGTFVAANYRYSFPRASAFTVGNVIISARSATALLADTALLRHEDRHCTQYAWCLGPLMVVLYLAASAFSWVIAGDHFSYNPFERLANLADGHYPKARSRIMKRRLNL